jgi:Zn-dependent M28 family amino/carboxypeptidase
MINIISNNPPKLVYDGPDHQDVLRSEVTKMSIPRHYIEEPESNKKIFQLILDRFLSWGYQTRVIGKDRNIVAYSKHLDWDHPYILVGAHYDSVPKTPGADDNASAVVAMLQVAAALQPSLKGDPNVIFAAFNQEEDGLLGSKAVVRQFAEEGIRPKEVHILEMVGFTAETQTSPPDLPISFPRAKGDFIALLSNNKSNAVCEKLMGVAEKCNLPAVGIQTSVPPEHLPSILHRSDHSSFWMLGIPAILWTDTAEFRTTHYHQLTDTPDTLDYDFMARVIQTLLTYLGK